MGSATRRRQYLLNDIKSKVASHNANNDIIFYPEEGAGVTWDCIELCVNTIKKYNPNLRPRIRLFDHWVVDLMQDDDAIASKLIHVRIPSELENNPLFMRGANKFTKMIDCLHYQCIRLLQDIPEADETLIAQAAYNTDKERFEVLPSGLNTKDIQLSRDFLNTPGILEYINSEDVTEILKRTTKMSDFVYP